MGNNRNNEYNPSLQVSIQPNIGLDSDSRQSVVDMLNRTLADETMLMIKTRHAHWNVSGPDFFELLTFFDLQLKQLNEILDDLAERVRMLGGLTIGGLKDISDHTRLVERPSVIPDILHLLADHETVIRIVRKDTQKCSEEYEDEGTSTMLVSIMRKHEKMAWMLRSYTETEVLSGKDRSV